ncbi:NADH-quinone oxidoreductase subunit NuoH [Candidatus Viridilinea mediisalina]|uniref:NADH-quinone oxidoreductase subunit H n=1 Tax=Candidatus Viridilinea mediisalina TaxID=2024553 RepID=A0A2A6RID1_9CHLR|nr:NADH-quinone oxidoreductase subunit NuoH [Candidatus Viridilinea mediisalina]PDW02701.1 NADH-quinone oxidoreductase subunit H [Candidatus Viridilinea mediisalina]
MDWIALLILIIQCFVIALGVTTAFAYLTLFERRLLARFQNRIGPNRAGPNGFLQPVADAVKLFFKEDVVPSAANRAVYLLAPAMAVIPAIIIWAVIPFGCLDIRGNWQACFEPQATTPLQNILQVAEINIGVLYLLAVTSIGVYGITLAGWASNNKYSMLGGIRSAAHLVSYELALACAVLAVVMTYGTFSTHQIVVAQAGLWGIVPQFLAFVIFMIAATAEVVRLPFDLVEAEQELVGGYNTEYGSMKFALFFMTEYIKLIAVSAIAVIFFMGGWRFPGLYTLGAGVENLAGPMAASIAVGLASLGAFLLKLVAFLFLSVWIRASWPRMRYDRLMDLGWKWLLPLALLNIVYTAVAFVLIPNETLASFVLLALGVLTLVIAMGINRVPKPVDNVTYVKDLKEMG